MSFGSNHRKIMDAFRYDVRTLSDYFEEAGLGGVPENILGMVEQIVISHGRTFTGTFYSSFSAHVFRHRLYLGKVCCVLLVFTPFPPLSFLVYFRRFSLILWHFAFSRCHCHLDLFPLVCANKSQWPITSCRGLSWSSMF